MAITGNLSIVTSNGTTISASSDISLAWLWAENEVGEDWSTITYGAQCDHVSDALFALREAYETGNLSVT